MSDQLARTLSTLAKWSVFSLAFVGLVIYPNVLFPDVLTKGLYVRFLVLLGGALALWLVLARRMSLPRRTPLLAALGIFFALLLVSMFVSPSIYRSFWGEVNRMEGVFGLLHYGVLFLTVRMVFQKEDWLRYFKLVAISVPLLVLYAVLQYVAARTGWDIPFVVNPSPSPGSLFGNTAFFSVFLIFGAGFALLVRAMERNKAWRRFSLFVIAAALLTIVWLGVRGEVLGALIGILVFFGLRAWWGGGRRMRIWFAAALLTLLIAGGALVALKDRYGNAYPRIVARIVNLPDEPSFRTRWLSLQSSAKAWLHSPKTVLLGWGEEHFMTGYNLYYDPRHGTYEDAWFDRAHNRVADALVMGGVLGALSYLALFGVLVWYLLRLMKNEATRRLAVASGALLAAYVAQNLTLFDLPHTYVNFVLLAAFLDHLLHSRGMPEASRDLVRVSGVRLAAGAAATALVLWLMVVTIFQPLRQAGRYLFYLRTHEGSAFLANADRIFTPRTFVQYALADDLWRRMKAREDFRNPAQQPLTDLLIRELQAVLESDPKDASMALRLANVYTENAIGLDDAGFAEEAREAYEQGEAYVRQAIALAPTRQETYYQLAFNLQGQGKKAEAVQVMRDTVALNPGTTKAHYILGINLALAGDVQAAVEKIEFVRERGWFQGIQELEVRNIELIYAAAGRRDLLPRVLASLLGAGISRAPEHFVLVIRESIKEKNTEETVRWAVAYANAHPDVRDDMMLVVQLAENGEWDILSEL